MLRECVIAAWTGQAVGAMAAGTLAHPETNKEATFVMSDICLN